MRGNRDHLLEQLWGMTWPALALAVLIAVAIWVIVRLRARYRSDEDPAAQAHEMLSLVRELHRQGQLSDEEFRSIKSRQVRELDGSIRAQDKKTE